MNENVRKQVELRSLGRKEINYTISCEEDSHNTGIRDRTAVLKSEPSFVLREAHMFKLWLAAHPMSPLGSCTEWSHCRCASQTRRYTSKTPSKWRRTGKKKEATESDVLRQTKRTDPIDSNARRLKGRSLAQITKYCEQFVNVSENA